MKIMKWQVTIVKETRGLGPSDPPAKTSRLQVRHHCSVKNTSLHTLTALCFPIGHYCVQDVLDVRFLQRHLDNTKFPDVFGHLTRTDHRGVLHSNRTWVASSLPPSYQSVFEIPEILNLMMEAGISDLHLPVTLLVEDFNKLAVKVLLIVPGTSSHTVIRLEVVQHVDFLFGGIHSLDAFDEFLPFQGLKHLS